MTEPDARYLTDEYLAKNPSWDQEDSPWKASLVEWVLRDNHVSPASMCEVGCGAGYVLLELHRKYPQAELFGFDIAPAASRFWPKHEAAGIQLAIGDFFALNTRTYDVVLVLDVIEHVRDPLAFLAGLRQFARHVVLHIPLDLSALSVAREKPLLAVRQKVGHIHYFTKNLALATVQESGYRVVDWRYTGAAFTTPRPTFRTRAAMAPRWLAQKVNRDWAARALGGETIIVLAESVATT